jgi:hypothetical protein
MLKFLNQNDKNQSKTFKKAPLPHRLLRQKVQLQNSLANPSPQQAPGQVPYLRRKPLMIG